MKVITDLVVLIHILKFFLKFGSGLPMNGVKEKQTTKEVKQPLRQTIKETKIY